jgi:hypothetical protein
MGGRAAIVLITLLSVLVSPTTAAAGWWPPRPTYDYDKAAGDEDCTDPGTSAADHGRCGAVDGPVLNSFVNTPSYGDERAFLDARRTSNTAAGSTVNVLHYATYDGGDITLRMYVNNGANEAYGERTTAKGTQVRVQLPTGTARALRIRASISADNATPAEVTDTVDLTDHRPFRLLYVPGSARLLRENRSFSLSDAIVGTGAAIGDQHMDGNFPAGFDKSALVVLRVQAVPVAAGDSSRGWIGAGAAGLLLLGLAGIPRTRRAATRGLAQLWEIVKGPEVLPKVIAGVLTAGIVGGAGMLIKALLE